jgi:hypothetical protein
MSQEQKQVPEVSNDEFLREAFKNATPDEKIWVLSKAVIGDSDWNGQLLQQSAPAEPLNNYTSPDTLRTDGRRVAANHAATHWIVLDDVQPDNLPVAPSYLIETSEGSYQAGYFLEQPETNIERVNSIMSLLSSKDNTISDTSGNNPVRVVRLPVGRHTKKGYDTRMVEWTPENRFRIDSLERAFREKIYGRIEYEEFVLRPEDYYESGSEEARERFISHLKSIQNGIDYHESINRIAARLITNGLKSTDVVLILQSLMQASQARFDDHARWQIRYNDIERSVRTAEQKFGTEGTVTKTTTAFRPYDYSLQIARPIEWVLDGFLAQGITIIAGAPGVGKTSKVVSLAILVAGLCDPSAELRPALRRRVVYITEDAAQAERLLSGYARISGLDTSEFTYWFEIRQASRTDPKTLEREIRTLVATHNVQTPEKYSLAPLVVLDTSNAVLDMEDENSNSEVGKFVSALKRATGTGSLWLIAHTAKALGRADTKGLSARGAGAFEGDANAVAYVFQEDGVEDYRFMRLGKHRYEAESLELRFSTQTYEERVPTPWGDYQQVRIRVAFPEQSSQEERSTIVEVTKERRKNTATTEVDQRIRDDVLELLREGATSKNVVETRVQGQAAKIRSVLLNLELAGLITMTKAPKNSILVALVPSSV